MKPALGFLAGTIFSAVLVMSAGASRRGFVLVGFFFAIAILGAVIQIAGAARIARFFTWLAGEPARTQKTRVRDTAKVSNKNGYVKPSKRQQLQNMADTVEEYRSRMSKPGPADASPRNPQVDEFLNDEELFGEGKVA